MSDMREMLLLAALLALVIVGALALAFYQSTTNAVVAQDCIKAGLQWIEGNCVAVAR